jgi:Tetracyclin repressor-like, C-terminal domain
VRSANKEELLDLMQDEIMGEVLLPADELPADWRAALTAIAHRTRVTILRHPWVLGAPPAASGPNGMRHFEQSLAAVASLDLDFADRFDIICAVDDYTYGYLLREVEQEREDASPYATEEWLEGITAYFEAQWSTGEFPHVQRLVAGSTPRGLLDRMNAMAHDQARFDRRLEWLLNGLQRSLTPGSPQD